MHVDAVHDDAPFMSHTHAEQFPGNEVVQDDVEYVNPVHSVHGRQIVSATVEHERAA